MLRIPCNTEWRRWFVAIAICGLCAAGLRAQPAAAQPELLDDAELTAATFINADQGWVVGDRGVIRRTDDGGRTWRQQPSPVACRLEAIHFLNADTGWAVGGWTHPYTQRTTGVVLRTRDGGLTWSTIPGLMLPNLRYVRFIDNKQGWAAGDRSAMYPTGLFWTDDGGRTWTPVNKGASVGWRSAVLRPEGRLLLLGLDGSLAEATRMEIKTLAPGDAVANRARRIALNSHGVAYFAGDDGVFQSSSDFGRTWTAPGEAFAKLTSGFDFSAVATLGSHCWIAGAPGTFVFHSADDGKTWERFATEHLPPIRALAFADEQRGWAVGDFGAVLATKDGGRTWRVQQQGNMRAGLFNIVSSLDRVPWEWTAQCGGSDGYRCVLEVIGRDAQDSPLVSSRLHEALVALGGTHAEQARGFPLPRRDVPLKCETVIDAWSGVDGRAALSRLEEHLVRNLRMWRPDVVLTEDASPRGEDPLAHVTNQVVLAAVKKAGEAAEYPSHAERLGLKPWRVRKLAAQLPAERRGAVTLTTSQLAPKLGKSIAELAETGRALFVDRPEPAPPILSANLLVDHVPQGVGRQDLMSGLSVRPGEESRRKSAEAVAGSMDALARLTQRRHNIQQMIARTQIDSPQAASWLGQVNELTVGMSDRAAGDVLFQLAGKYEQAGKPELAAEAYAALLERRGPHPLAESAALWLVRYYSSGETSWRLRHEQKYGVQVTTYEAPAQVVDEDEFDENGKPLKKARKANEAQADSQGLTTAAEQHASRALKALAVAKYLERNQPALFAEPMIRLPAVAAQRVGPPQQPTDKQIQLPAAQLGAPWSRALNAEYWIAQPRGNGPIPTITAAVAAKPPVLDGSLDDAIWQTAKGAMLKKLDPDAPNEAGTGFVIARDDAFLYVAASCRRSSACTYTPDRKPRVPDADLRAFDRLEISLDIDRDYTTAYRFVIDHNGRLAADLWNDPSWNPHWFVAADGDENFWTLEAAIPWEELTPRVPQAKESWAIAVERILPGAGRQSLAPTADLRSSDRFGLLLFE